MSLPVKVESWGLWLSGYPIKVCQLLDFSTGTVGAPMCYRSIGLDVVTVSTMSLSPQFMESLWVRKSFSAAGHTLLVYDYLLTFRDEFVYIWDAPWTIVKILFLLNRYGNLIGQTVVRLEEAGLLAHDSQKFCQCFAIFTSCFMFLSVESIHILVLVRAWAIWGTQKRVTNILAWSYVIYVVTLLASTSYSLYAGNIQYLFLDVIHVCVTTMPISGYTLGNFSHSTRLVFSMCFFEMRSSFSSTAFWNNPKYFLAKGFATPLLSVVGQRLVLNLRGLKTRTYATRDLSREVDRQLQAFAEADLDDVE
ncbi:hypothetical protein DFJ58DRAFT_840669 [Suillus subalutaceus]|uniref:uncharacterized protein n=1 Tax=Suillus subalutaceus TaxID=48586 RepID=UPI001B86CD7B|nr:uncharacterized protein DFJ58DRAFT_840669 [Suillus subalutaceus]KAG1857380.1 hypothetical protein DFJ58DRAFT_840669 [Suillus subalutaceus]